MKFLVLLHMIHFLSATIFNSNLFTMESKSRTMEGYIDQIPSRSLFECGLLCMADLQCLSWAWSNAASTCYLKVHNIFTQRKPSISFSLSVYVCVFMCLCVCVCVYVCVCVFSRVSSCSTSLSAFPFNLWG